MKLRPGNAGSNTAGDHQDVFDQAMDQLPVRHRRHVLVRSDSAGGSKQFVNYLVDKNSRQRTVEYSVGMPVTQQVRDAITTVDAQVWQSTVNSAGQASDVDESAVAELTDLLTYDGWPEGMRLMVRHERPHPGAQLDMLEEADGYRYTLFATNTTVGQLQQLEARPPPLHDFVIVAVGGAPRAHARVENRIKDAKATGLDTMPSKHWASNLAWTHSDDRHVVDALAPVDWADRNNPPTRPAEKAPTPFVRCGSSGGALSPPDTVETVCVVAVDERPPRR